MRVLYLSAGQDTGGQGFRIKRAFDRHAPGWEARSMCMTDTYIGYPKDAPWDEQEARRLYKRADVVHHRNTMALYELFDRGQHKPAVLHHHGSRLRNNPLAVRAEGKTAGAVQVVSTIDLLDDVPWAKWLPSPFDLEEMAAYRRPLSSRRPRRLRFCHAPTVRSAKGTDTVLDALNLLSDRHHIELDLVEGASWDECLRRKGRCDIYIDQLTLGYGNNAIEAWAMGIPVVSGFTDPADRELFLARSGETATPFWDVTGGRSAAALAEMIEPLIVDETLRDSVGVRGRNYAERQHEERSVVARLTEIYKHVPRSTGRVQLMDDSTSRRIRALGIGVAVA